MAYLTIPIAEKTETKFVNSIKLAAAMKPDIIELRTDCLHCLTYDTLEKLIKTAHSFSIPVIVTCRDEKEGGMHSHSQLVRLEVLCEAVRLAAEYIDCEYANYANSRISEQIDKAIYASHSPCRLILSAHNFTEPFYDINSLYENIIEANHQAIPKLAYAAKHINDCFQGFDLLENRQGDLIIACMGEAGQIMRLTAGKTGNYLAFAAADDESCTAPGQPTVECLRMIYRFDKINAETNLYGIIANPVSHSASPAVYNASFDTSGHNGLYLPLLVEGGQKDFDKFMDNILKRPNLGFRGFSITIPHKTCAFDYVGKNGTLEPNCHPIGAINTIKISCDKKIKGYNTDFYGILNPLNKTIGSLEGKKVAILGAGGVSKAAAAALSQAKADITIFNRTVEKAQQLAEKFACCYDSNENLQRIAAEDFDIVINCTSIGMSPDINASPLNADYINASMTVFDTVYNPMQTILLKSATEKGAKVINGLEMFIAQAIGQYEILTGEKPAQEIIEQTLINKLQLK